MSGDIQDLAFAIIADRDIDVDAGLPMEVSGLPTEERRQDRIGKGGQIGFEFPLVYRRIKVGMDNRE